MPKRTPSGRTKRVHRDRRPAPPAAASFPPSVDAPPAEPRGVEIAPAAAPRESILASVRRPARKAGPALITDYRYVTADLRRIAGLAVTATVILVALTLVIR